MTLTPQTLKQRRERLGLSHLALSRVIGIPRQTIWGWEQGKIAIQHPEVLDLALSQLEEQAMKEQQAIEQVAGTICDALNTGLISESEVWEDAIRRNEGEGWTFDGPKSRAGLSLSDQGDYLRYEGVRLTAEQLSRAYQLGREWFAVGPSSNYAPIS